jgi:hypothetical protein
MIRSKYTEGGLPLIEPELLTRGLNHPEDLMSINLEINIFRKENRFLNEIIWGEILNISQVVGFDGSTDDFPRSIIDSTLMGANLVYSCLEIYGRLCKERRVEPRRASNGHLIIDPYIFDSQGETFEMEVQNKRFELADLDSNLSKIVEIVGECAIGFYPLSDEGISPRDYLSIVSALGRDTVHYLLSRQYDINKLERSIGE